MKQITLLAFVFIFGLSLGFAQKGKVNSASSSLSLGKLDNAKEAIDQAITHEDTKDWVRTWFVYGSLYQAIAEDATGLYKKLDSDALNKAYDGYLKALELDQKPNKKGKIKPKYTKDIMKKLREPENKALSIKLDMLQAGIDFYNKADYAKAFEAFEKSLNIDKITKLEYADTSIIYNAALCASHSKQYDKAIKYFRQAADLKYGGGNLYLSMANAYRGNKDTTTALKVLQEGIKKYPNDNQMLITDLINHYIFTENTDEALKFLNIALEKDPKNESFHFAKGVMYDKIQQSHLDNVKKLAQEEKDLMKEGKNLERKKWSAKSKSERAKIDEQIKNLKSEKEAKGKEARTELKTAGEYLDKAVECYHKSLELKPDYFEGNYNLGVVYINKGNRILEEANNIPPSADKDGKKFEAKKAEASEIFKKGIPYLEKAYKVDPSDEGLKQALSEIYIKLQMYDKAKALKGN